MVINISVQYYGRFRPVFVYSLGGGQKSHGINGK